MVPYLFDGMFLFSSKSFAMFAVAHPMCLPSASLSPSPTKQNLWLKGVSSFPLLNHEIDLPLQETGAEQTGDDHHDAANQGCHLELWHSDGIGGTAGAAGALSVLGTAGAAGFPGACDRRAWGLGASFLRAIASKTGSVTSPVGEVLGGLGWHGGKLIVLDEPCGGTVWAVACLSVGLVATITGRRFGLAQGIAKSREIILLLSVLLDVNQAVFRLCGIALHAVLVHETSRVDGSHLGSIDGSDLAELALGLDAAEFGKEDGDGVVAERLDLLLISGGLVVGRITPRVVIEGKEVGSLIVGSAVEIVGGFDTVVVNVGSGVPDRDGAVSTVANVLFHVTGDSLDVGSGRGRLDVVDDFVTREEKEGVAVLLELINGGKDALEVFGVVRRAWLVLSNGVLGRIYVKGQVDTSLCEGIHAFVVALAVVDGIDTDRVELEFFELCNVLLADIGIGQRVLSV